MPDTRQPSGFLFKRAHPSDRETDRDLRVAYLLQQGEPGDPRLLDLLAEVYGGEIYRFALVLMEGRKHAKAQAWELAARSLASAVADLDECAEEPNVWLWLLKRTRRLANQGSQLKGKPGVAGAAKVLGESVEPIFPAGKPASSRPINEFEASTWQEVEAARAEERLILALHYVFDLEIPGIAAVSGLPTRRVSQALKELRQRLPEFIRLEQRYAGKPHGDQHRLVQDSLDSRPGLASGLAEQIEQHLSNCADCRSFAGQLSDLENKLRDHLRRYWPQPEWGLEQIARLQTEGRSWLEQGPQRRLPPLKQLLWAGGISLVFLILGWRLFQVAQQEIPRQPVAQVTANPTPIALPVTIEIGEPLITQAEFNPGASPGQAGFSLQPALSSDGRALVFSSSSNLPGASASTPGTQLYHYDTHTGELRQIELNSADPSLPDSWKLDPGLSADGRYLVFTAVPIDAGRSFLETNRPTGIFVHDLETGLTERIDRGFDGSPANDASYAASISADGRFVTFWSGASNLTPDDPQTCWPDEASGPCLDIFVYDREKRTTTRIPIGRNGLLLFASDRPAISLDGRLVALTLYVSDLAAESLGLGSILEAYLYDLPAGEFLPVALSSDGKPGDGISYAVSLAADGRHAVFAADSSNLVPGDENGSVDVFVRDLQLGTIELVDWSQGDGFEPYGRSFPFNAGWGNELSMSNDGRFMTFLSSAKIISDSPPVLCNSMEAGCNAVLVYDRATNVIEQITEPMADRKYLFPSVSEDGRWVSFMESNAHCKQQLLWRVCSEVWLYDRELERLLPISKAAFLHEEPMWTNESDLSARDAHSSRLASMGVDKLLISPDHTTIVGTFGDSRLGIWDLLAEGQPLYLETASGARVTVLSFSPDGSLLAAGDQSGNVELWDLPGFKRASLLDNHLGEVLQLGFSSQGDRLLVQTGEALWIWERREENFVLSGKIELTVKQPRAVALFPSATHMAMFADVETIWLRSIPSGEVVTRLESLAPVNASGLVISPDERFLAAAQEAGQVDLWKLENKAAGGISASYLFTLRNPEPVKMLTFSQDSGALAVSTLHGHLLIWSIPAGEIISVPQPREGWRKLTGIFAFDSGILAAGFEAGGVHLWRSGEIISQPRFFQRVEAEAQFSPESAGIDWIGIVRHSPIRNTLPDSPVVNLYQAYARAGFGIRAPAFLPLGMSYQGAFLASNASVTLTYAVENQAGATPTGWLALSQRRVEAGWEGFPIGEHALVEAVDIEGIYAEYVRGEWTLHKDNMPAWEVGLSTQRLSWQEAGIQFNLSYHQGSLSPQAGAYLSRADLIGIASSLVDLGYPVPPETDLVAYIDRQGGGCQVNIERRGVGLSSPHELSGNQALGCHLIFLGNPVGPPDNTQQLPFAESDLDADGLVERLEIVVQTGKPGEPVPLEIRLLAPSRNGLYLTHWRYPITGDFVRLEVLPCSGCEQLLQISSGKGPDYAQLLFRWNGQEMLPVAR